MSSTSQRPRPGRRRQLLVSPVLTILILLVSMLSFTSAYDMSFENGVYESTTFREFEERGEIHIDTRPEPIPHLERRQVGQDFPSSSSSSPSSTSTSSSASAIATSITIPSSSSATPNATTTASPATAPSTTVITTPLPSPFDVSIGNNFTTSSCPTFFTNFLSNATFRSCIPVSLLLQNSASFFRAQRSPSLLASTLNAACAAPLSVCTPLLTSFATELISDSNCGHDFRDQQPLVLQAYNGLVAYEPVYRATCLKDNSDNYCYADAITNLSNPSDTYPYFTAVGLNLPAAARPSCTDCLKQTMQVFAEYAVRREQPLAQTYLTCAGQVDAGCGSGFADTQVKAGSVDSGIGEQVQALKNGGEKTMGLRPTVLALAGVIGLMVVV